MWDNIFKLVTKATSVSPVYTKTSCIAYKQSMSICSVCRDVCPHEAISFLRGKEVQIDEIDCTGCGICVQSCPSQALEPKVNYQTEVPLKCSQVKGGAQTTHCLGRLSATDLLRLAGRKDTVHLVRSDCAGCKIGTERVPELLDETINTAKKLATLKQRDVNINVQILERFDATDNPERISRRDLLRGGFKGIQHTAADMLAPLDPGGDEEKTLPREMQRQFRMIESSQPEADAMVPWSMPRVADGCVMCPMCTKACPTEAFRRDFEPKDKEAGGSVLILEPEKCNGCNACVKVCPTKVITLDEEVSWGELTAGEQEAYYKEPHLKFDPKTVSR